MKVERKIRKAKKRFLRDEKRRLQKRIFYVKGLVDEVLREEFNRRLYRLKPDDENRLLTLLVWRDKYHVSVRWILKELIPVWSKFTKFQFKSAALGCRVATLVGQKSEEILRERISQQFPRGENKDEVIEQEKEKILSKLSRQDTRPNVSKITSMFSFSSSEKFIKAYRKELKCRTNKLKLTRKDSLELSQLKRKCFRNNPWQT